MKAILLVTLLFCTACGADKTNGSSKTVSEEPFNYFCDSEVDLDENGNTIFVCLELTTQNQCNVLYELNQYFESDCEEITRDLFQDYLKTRGN